MYNKKIRVLGSSVSNDIMPFNNKDRNKILLYDSFNTEVKKAIWSGLSMFNDPIKDNNLYKTLDESTKKNLEKSNFDEAKKIIDKDVKKLNSTDVLNIGSDKIKSDINEIGDGLSNYYDKAKNYLNELVKYPLIIGSVILLIILLKK